MTYAAIASGMNTSNIPVAPVINSVTATGQIGNQVTISYTLEQRNLPPITSISITSSPSISLTFTNNDLDGSINVTGAFVLNQSYTFIMTATNAIGTSNNSNTSSSVTPNVNPTVTGGTLSSDATYYYRTFTSNGTLSISGKSMQFDFLVIGGGGGGGYGGGGAGGVRQSSAIQPIGNHIITVGGGGTGSSILLSGGATFSASA